MKFFALVLALFCAVAYATAGVTNLDRDLSPDMDIEAINQVRMRRDADPEPQGSVTIHGTKPLSGPDRRPSLDVNYNQRVFDRNGATADAYGGMNIRPGQKPQPHIGIQAERQFGNGFIRGHGQVQRGPGGRPDPSFGITGGFRFRREIHE